jgi:hypothetical protein
MVCTFVVGVALLWLQAFCKTCILKLEKLLALRNILELPASLKIGAKRETLCIAKREIA